MMRGGWSLGGASEGPSPSTQVVPPTRRGGRRPQLRGWRPRRRTAGWDGVCRTCWRARMILMPHCSGQHIRWPNFVHAFVLRQFAA
jgi:hypothetical protein